MIAAEGRPIAVRVLVTLLVFQGLSGVAGGYGLTRDPTGSAVGLDLRWLEGSPFPDYLVPGVVLLLALGIVPLVVAAGILWRLRGAWLASLLVGLALINWIGVQVAIIGYISQPPLQLIYGLVGVGLVATALLPAVRQHVMRRRR